MLKLRLVIEGLGHPETAGLQPDIEIAGLQPDIEITVQAPGPEALHELGRAIGLAIDGPPPPWLQSARR